MGKVYVIAAIACAAILSYGCTSTTSKAEEAEKADIASRSPEKEEAPFPQEELV